MASVVFTIGSVVMAVSPNKYVREQFGKKVNFETKYMQVLLGGRIVVGMGIGMASMCIPVYMAETSPVELRGFLGASFQVEFFPGVTFNSLFQVMICFGQVVAAIVDAAFGEVSTGLLSLEFLKYCITFTPMNR